MINDTCKRCALFDMDGVLYDSMKGHSYAYREALKEFGIDMPEEMVYACEGKKGTETMKLVAKELQNRVISDEEAEEMYQAKCRVFRSLPIAEKIPGVEHLMQTMKEHGMQMCVVTGSGQISLLHRLVADFPGLIDEDHIVCSLDYAKGKPAPDPYLMGLARCNSTAEETIVVENAPLGVMAAKAAGIFTVAVNTGPLQESVFHDAGADVVVGTMAEAEKVLFDADVDADY